MGYKYNKEEYIKKQNETMDKLLEDIKKGIKEVYKSDNWKKHLETISKFYKYSHKNILLIETQCPGATLVAGYKKWQTEFDRQVKKGESGIKILMPVQLKEEIIERDKNGNAIKDENGEIKKKVQKFLAFKYTNVFDLSQTEGKELEIFKINLLDNSVENKENMIQAIKEIAESKGNEFVFENIHDGAKGYYSPLENKIAIQKDMPDLQTIKTAIHELAHSILHDPINNQNISKSDLLDRSKIEIEAESVAYVISSKYGLDTSDYSFKYIASWASNKDEKELSEILENIKESSQDIIEKIDMKLELNKDLDRDIKPQEKETLEALKDMANRVKAKSEKTNETKPKNKDLER